MFRSLVRLLGMGEAPRTASTRSFAPRLEVLDGRTMPSVVGVGVIEGGGLAGGVLPGDALGGVVLTISRASGEEIPQTV